MKRFLKIFLFTIAGIFLLLLILPFAFRGKIETKVKEVINQKISATVAWDKFSLSLIRNFPNLGIGLEGLSIVNKAPFEGDTLMYVGKFAVSADLMSALKGDAIDIRSILIDNPQVNLKTNSDSISNWDIFPISDEEEEAEEEDGEVSSFGVQLQSFEIRNAALSYSDSTMNLETALRGFNALMKGDLSASYTTIAINSNIEALNLKMDGIKYVDEAAIAIRANVGADLDSMIFRFEDNEFNLGGIPLSMEGMIAMLEEGMDMDLKLAATDTEFKTLLALVPDEFIEGFEGLKTSGSLALQATAKGVFVDSDNLPAFNLLLQVKDGFVQYPDLPKSINAIQVDVLVDNPGGKLDNTLADIKDFSFSIDGNPFGGKLKVTTPVSNATFDGGVKGIINLASLTEALPIDSIFLKGIVNADLTLLGDYNMIEQEKYEDLKANGLLSLSDFEYRSLDLPIGVIIPSAVMDFSPRYVELSSFICQVGESDFSFTGRLENYLAYVLQDGTLKGKLQHASKYINANELMALSGEEEEAAEEKSEPLGKVLVPDNIDFDMTTKIDRLQYDKLTLENTKGGLAIKDSRVLLNGINTNLLNGSMALNGEYNTQDTLKPFVDFDLAINTIDINMAANSFSMIDSLLPIAKKANGRVSSSFNFSSLIGDGFSPVISSLNGGGLLKSDEITVSGAKVQTALVSMLKDDKYSVARARDFLVNFTLENGNLFVKPFDVNVFDKKANISGKQGLDKSMDYLIKMPVSRSELGSVAGFLGGTLPEGEDIMVGIKITGTLTDPKLGISTQDVSSAVKDEVKKAATEAANKVVEKASEELVKEAEKVVDDLLKDEETKEKLEDAGKKLKDLFGR
jgi:hypothetical protein